MKESYFNYILYGLAVLVIIVLAFSVSSLFAIQKMNSNSKMGLLNSVHIHTDLKIFKDGKVINLAQQKYFVQNRFAHVEVEDNPEETGNVLHIHATGVPLSLFIESIRLNLDSPRLFVNGEEKDFGTYIPENQDKILVTTSTDELIKQELSSITDYSKNH